jgi:hypothetical protein
VHKVLTRTTYIGRHRFNTKYWKTRERKPDAEVVEMIVPPIIEAAEFEAVQTALKTRSPALTAPRIVSGPTLLTGICFCAACGGAMTLSAVLHRRKERAGRRTAHIAELRKRATEAEAKLKRLYDAIENGIADVSDPMLKERVTELKSIRDQARADAERAEGAIDRSGPSITPQALKTFASQARRRMRTESGGPPPSAGPAHRSRCERSSHHGVQKRTAAHPRRR